ISTRPRTAASVSWIPPVWTTPGEAGVDQQTPDISVVIQDVINRPGWTSGNALSIIITGTGERVAHSFDSNAGPPATLHLTYVEVGQERPMVNAGPDQIISITETVTLDATVTDDGLPGGGVTTLWDVVSGPGVVTFDDASSVDTTATFSAVGTYLLRLTADDGQLSASDEAEITVTTQGGGVVLEVQVAGGAEDGEESATGDVSTTSSDLELVQEATTQVVGIRFNGLGIPAGSQITSAWIQFTADEVDAEPTTLSIRAQAADTAPVIQQVLFDITSRLLTSAETTWVPPAWNLQGESSTAQRTSDVSAVLQEVIDRQGWTEGNAVMFIISGSGKRVAESHNGSPAGAAILHVEYLAP
ncbi:MAG: PKD domain-containing protein, partial [Acidimicrobiia bacterium]|nr:PKD domain-containing protein [Acidimicrobiia bacterium]